MTLGPFPQTRHRGRDAFHGFMRVGLVYACIWIGSYFGFSLNMYKMDRSQHPSNVPSKISAPSRRRQRGRGQYTT
jgi:hypothetical protein